MFISKFLLPFLTRNSRKFSLIWASTHRVQGLGLLRSPFKACLGLCKGWFTSVCVCAPYEWSLIMLLLQFFLLNVIGPLQQTIKLTSLLNWVPRCWQALLGLTGPLGLLHSFLCLHDHSPALLCSAVPTWAAADIPLKTSVKGWDRCPFTFSLGFIRGFPK